MMRSIIFAAGLGVLAALPPALYFASGPAREDPAAPRGDAVAAETAAVPESWRICTSMDFAEGPAWAPLDPEFAAGKRALAAGDWASAISILTPAGLRDDRNADIQNYLGYAYRQFRQFDPALKHYQKAVRSIPATAAPTSISARPIWCSAISPKPGSTSRRWSASASSPARSTMTSNVPSHSTTRLRRGRLFRFEVGRPDQLGPFLGLVCDQLSE